MSKILGRIRIKHVKGADILYTTDKSVLENFGLEHDKEFQDIRVIKNGTELQIDDKRYRVVDMYTYFYDETYDNDENKGISLIGAGDRYAFNFDITYYVETVE
jgi:hypothetical protein